jgi:hypothetical protein
LLRRSRHELVMSMAATTSVELDDHLAKGATFAHIGQRVRHFIEPKFAVDVDA